MRNVSLQGMKYVVGGDKLVGPSRLEMRHASNGAVMRTFVGHTGYVTCLCISSDENRLASGSNDATIRLWDAIYGTELLTIRGHTKTVRSLCFNADDTRLVSGSGDKLIKIWSTATGVAR